MAANPVGRQTPLHLGTQHRPHATGEGFPGQGELRLSREQTAKTEVAATRVSSPFAASAKRNVQGRLTSAIRGKCGTAAQSLHNHTNAASIVMCLCVQSI